MMVAASSDNVHYTISLLSLRKTFSCERLKGKNLILSGRCKVFAKKSSAHRAESTEEDEQG